MRWKYPRTPHLPWSPGNTDDDIKMTHTNQFKNKQVVITEKLDGENTTLYTDGMHARSIDSGHHPSRSLAKQLHARIQQEIPDNWRLCGENVYATHSIAYDNLEGFFYLFSVWNEKNICLSWDETLEWAQLLGIPTPRTLFEGVWNEQLIRNLNFNTEEIEGYIVRIRDAFSYCDFHKSVAKWVRKGHVQSNKHWMELEIVPNKLKDPNA
ncbi:MAG: RNA ligase family protein [Chlamydiia bacterium]|nr:RNA ligase family protein [Chlamydiia bacterium]MCP5491676.1 RNA ligase family protein [Chlamydiales bacterium]